MNTEAPLLHGRASATDPLPNESSELLEVPFEGHSCIAAAISPPFPINTYHHHHPRYTLRYPLAHPSSSRGIHSHCMSANTEDAAISALPMQ